MNVVLENSCFCLISFSSGGVLAATSENDTMSVKHGSFRSKKDCFVRCETKSSKHRFSGDSQPELIGRSITVPRSTRMNMKL